MRQCLFYINLDLEDKKKHLMAHLSGRVVTKLHVCVCVCETGVGSLGTLTREDGLRTRIVILGLQANCLYLI